MARHRFAFTPNYHASYTVLSSQAPEDVSILTSLNPRTTPLMHKDHQIEPLKALSRATVGGVGLAVKTRPVGSGFRV